jgi:polysaccharide pyruvyl transferase CsaB
MNVFVVGWFGAGNIGDEAILYSELSLLKNKIQGIEFSILSFDPSRTKKLTTSIPEVKKIIRIGSKLELFRSDFLGIYTAIKRADAVMIGGGGLFQDIYNSYPIPFFTSLALLTRLMNKPSVLFCVGIGPIKTYIGRKLCRMAVNSIKVISVRDEESMILLKEIGVWKKIHLSTDPAFLLSPIKTDSVENIINAYGFHASGPDIGVCVQNLLYWGDQAKSTLAEIFDSLIEKSGARIFFIPFGVYRNTWSFKHASEAVDILAAKELMAMMKAKSYLVDTGNLNPSEISALIKNMSLMISMRLHGLILALAAKTPIIAITYKKETKIKNLMKRIAQEKNLFEITSLNARHVLERILYMLETKDHLEASTNLTSQLKENAGNSSLFLLKALPNCKNIESNM